MNTPNPKCSSCACYFESTLKSSGLPYKTCTKCRDIQKEKIPCECGIRIRRDAFTRHQNGKLHFMIMKENENREQKMSCEEIKRYLYRNAMIDKLNNDEINEKIKLGDHYDIFYQWNQYDYVK